VPAFERLFAIVAAVPRRPLQIHAPPCAALGADEGRFLQMISLMQRQRHGDVAFLLGDWLPPAGVRLAMPALEDLALALARADLVVPLRHIEAAILDKMMIARGDPGLALIH
jgi:hypothetical protein